MGLKTYDFSKIQSDLSKWTAVRLVMSAAIGASFLLVSLNTNEINGFTTQPVHSHGHLVQVIIPNQKQCARCGLEKSISEFYTKGDRVDARCKSCVLSDKRIKRIEVKRTKTRRPRGRVIDLVQFTISATNLREAEPKAAQLALHEWIELVLGG